MSFCVKMIVPLHPRLRDAEAAGGGSLEAARERLRARDGEVTLFPLFGPFLAAACNMHAVHSVLS